MLLIPCGHTLCRICTHKTKHCRLCDCPVQSATDNISLQQIITDFQSQERARKEGNFRHYFLYLMGNFSCFILSSVEFFKSTISNNSFMNTIRVSKGLIPIRPRSKLFVKVIYETCFMFI